MARKFELTAKPIIGYSGGIFKENDRGTVLTVSGNTYDDHRKFVVIRFRDIEMILDRDEHLDEMLKRSASADEFYTHGLERLILTLKPTVFLAMLDDAHEEGKKCGEAIAQARMRLALGISSHENNNG